MGIMNACTTFSGDILSSLAEAQKNRNKQIAVKRREGRDVKNEKMTPLDDSSQTSTFRLSF